MSSSVPPTKKKRGNGPAPPVRILQLTDCHFPEVRGQVVQGVDPEQSFSRVTATVLDAAERFDLMLLTGDLADQPSAAAYSHLREQLRPLSLHAPCYCLPGNHDDPEAMRRFLAGGAIRMDSQIPFTHWEIICLDSSVPGQPGGFLGEREIDRLERAMADHPDKHILVAVHHHPIACGSEWMDTMILSNGERLSAALEAFPGRTRAVVFGHIHQSLDRCVRGVRYLGTPSTCCQFKPYSRTFSLGTLPPGFRWIELHPDGVLITETVHVRPKGSG